MSYCVNGATLRVRLTVCVVGIQLETQESQADLRIETCWSDFKCFNINSFTYVF